MTLTPDPARPGVALEASGAVGGRVFAPGWPGGPWQAYVAQGEGWARVGEAATRDAALGLLCDPAAIPAAHQTNLF